MMVSVTVARSSQLKSSRSFLLKRLLLTPLSPIPITLRFLRAVVLIFQLMCCREKISAMMKSVITTQLPSFQKRRVYWLVWSETLQNSRSTHYLFTPKADSEARDGISVSYWAPTPFAPKK